MNGAITPKCNGLGWADDWADADGCASADGWAAADDWVDSWADGWADAESAANIYASQWLCMYAHSYM